MQRGIVMLKNRKDSAGVPEHPGTVWVKGCHPIWGRFSQTIVLSEINIVGNNLPREDVDGGTKVPVGILGIGIGLDGGGIVLGIEDTLAKTLDAVDLNLVRVVADYAERTLFPSGEVAIAVILGRVEVSDGDVVVR